mgnify:CR=1 FL=1
MVAVDYDSVFIGVHQWVGDAVVSREDVLKVWVAIRVGAVVAWEHGGLEIQKSRDDRDHAVHQAQVALSAFIPRFCGTLDAIASTPIRRGIRARGSAGR